MLHGTEELGGEGGAVIATSAGGSRVLGKVGDYASEPEPREPWGAYVAREVDPLVEEIDLQRVAPFGDEP